MKVKVSATILKKHKEAIAGFSYFSHEAADAYRLLPATSNRSQDFVLEASIHGPDEQRISYSASLHVSQENTEPSQRADRQNALEVRSTTDQSG